MSAKRWIRLAIAALTIGSSVGCAHFVILHDPLSPSEHTDLGMVYESSGQLELAAKEYRHALKLDPRSARARVNLGNVEASRGQWRRAEKCYRRALADSSTDSDAMNNLAVALMKQDRRLAEARALAERAVGAGGERDSLYRATLAEVEAAQGRRR